MPSNERRINPRFYLFLLLVVVMIVASGMLIGFVLGFLSSLFSKPGDYQAASWMGLKAGIMMSAAVLTIGIVGLTLKRLRLHAMIESTGAFAAGFAVMNGLKSWLDGSNDKILSEAITGLLLGAIVGSGMYYFRRRGLLTTASDSKRRS